MVSPITPLKALAGALVACAAAASAHAGQPVELRHAIEAGGPALTLGDVFMDAGPAGGRAVSPAPRPGETMNVSARFLAAAAAAAGLAWAPPPGMDHIVVTRRAETAGARSPRQYAALTPANPMMSDAARAADALVQRGDTVTLVYVAPGLQLTTRGKALAAGGLGDSVRIVNLQSNQVVEATVTGPGAASANARGGF